MSGLKPVNWKRFDKFLLMQGCAFKYQKGGHRVYSYPEIERPIIVPAHSKELPIFIIRNNLRLLGISPEDYKKLIRKC